jgi:hypothetical protein
VRRPAPAFDYTTVGHVTADVLADGSRRPGGSAFYSALQAARLGKRTLILTQGAPQEIERLIEPYREEIELQVLPAPATTTLTTSVTLATPVQPTTPPQAMMSSQLITHPQVITPPQVITSSQSATSPRGAGEPRTQRVLAWAGQIAEVTVDTAILHIAPIARETPRTWSGRADFVGITPQGLARAWDGEHGVADLAASDERGVMRPAAPAQGALEGGCDALVLSEHERASCAGIIAAAREAGAVVAVTAGAQPTAILTGGGGGEVRIAVPQVARPREDLGAGDVFAAAFFIALAEGRSPARAAAFANAAAGVRVSGVGADAIGNREAVEARLRDTAPAPG